MQNFAKLTKNDKKLQNFAKNVKIRRKKAEATMISIGRR